MSLRWAVSSADASLIGMSYPSSLARSCRGRVLKSLALYWCMGCVTICGGLRLLTGPGSLKVSEVVLAGFRHLMVVGCRGVVVGV